MERGKRASDLDRSGGLVPVDGLATTRDEMIALLMDPAGGEERLDELRELLAELLRPRLRPVP